jgi:secernin
MCDTWLALRDATLTQQVIFAKNSDRPIFDCQPLLFYGRKTWKSGSKVQLEYVDVPQVETTYATLGSSPYWCWGFEEGINEHSVVIGNEAIFTKSFREAAVAHREGHGPAPGLLGMDLVRLALERSSSASEAVERMGTLIELYGQFGSGVPKKNHSEGGYDNAFLIADPNEGWILETAGTRWLAKRVAQGCASISNQPSIREEWDVGSRGIRDNAIEKGWWPRDGEKRFDFARAYIDETVPRQVSHVRAMRTRQLLCDKEGQITSGWMMRIARDHYEGTFLGGPYFDAADPDLHTICMHASSADFTWGNTASSCVAALPDGSGTFPVFWWTPGPPCNGCYVPFFVHGGGLPEIVTTAGTFGKRFIAPADAAEDAFAPDSYWWLFKRLTDKVKGDPLKSLPGHYKRKNRIVRARFDALEESFARQLNSVLAEATEQSERKGGDAARVLDAFSHDCVSKVVDALHELLVEFD